MSNPGCESAFGSGMCSWSSARSNDWMEGLVASRCVAQVKADDVVSCLEKVSVCAVCFALHLPCS
jgi:hypothetical protein